MNCIYERNRTFLSSTDLENKTVDVGGWGDVDEAYKIIKICSDRFDQIEKK
jgi:inorganic pyrophosphatase